jgi:hypothetical protein
LKKIVTVFNCLILTAFGFCSPAYAADIIPKLTNENDFFYAILLVVLLVIFFLLGLILGRKLGPSKEVTKENEKVVLEEPKSEPIDPNTFGQDMIEHETNQTEMPTPRNPRNPRNRYNNYW